ncbi:MAG: DNA polymerase III subunit delta' [Deltaproteobacteria bacterium]|nr:DNA polymerase III subunit delta' [Deltaproteobacteria bacterium]
MPYFLGHQATWQQLLSLYQKDHLPHGLLITGPQGVGKSLVGLCLAYALLCQKPQKNGEACGTCGSCQLMEKEEHPDFYRLAPEGTLIKIDAVREIQKNLNFSPNMGKNRVILIQESESFHRSAANALLKNLEEAPQNTYFILLSSAAGRVLPTLRSRCHHFRLGPLSEENLKEILSKQGFQSKNLAFYQGSASLALKLKEVEDQIPDLIHLQNKQQLLSETVHLLKNLNSREEVKNFLLALLLSLHHRLTQNLNLEVEERFSLLSFAQRILEIKDSLRLNTNAKIQITPLMMHFEDQ